MIESEKYSIHNEITRLIEKIRTLEEELINSKVGATRQGGYTYEFLLMEQYTDKLLKLTKPLQKEEEKEVFSVKPLKPYDDNGSRFF